MKTDLKVINIVKPAKFFIGFSLLILFVITPTFTIALAQNADNTEVIFEDNVISPSDYESETYSSSTESTILRTSFTDNITFNATTTGWMWRGEEGLAIPSTMSINGTAINLTSDIWDISASGMINGGGETANIQLEGTVIGEIIVLKGQGFVNNTREFIQLNLNGNVFPLKNDDDSFVLIFSDASFWEQTTGEIYVFIQTGLMDTVGLLRN